MTFINPSNQRNSIGFKGLIQEGTRSHGLFLISSIIAVSISFVFNFCGIFLASGNFLLSSFFALLIGALLFYFSLLATNGKINGNNFLHILGLFGLAVLVLISIFFGVYYYTNTLNDQKTSLLEMKYNDLDKIEQLIYKYDEFSKPLLQDSFRTKSNCTYSLLDPVNTSMQSWKTKVRNTRNRLSNPFCLIFIRDEILYRKGITFDTCYKDIVAQLESHNESWVSNIRCKVNIEVFSKQFEDYKTPMDINVPKPTGSFGVIKNPIYLILTLILSILSLLPYIAAKGAETILKSRH